MEELKACPFCGGEALVINVTPYNGCNYTGVCQNLECGANIGIYSDTREEAIKAWNKRAGGKTE
jgi:Lar family restriction alleviation protein